MGVTQQRLYVVNLESLATHIARGLPADRPFLIGIDGLAGSGKTTFCTRLVQELEKAQLTVKVVSLDESYWAEKPIQSSEQSRSYSDGDSVGEDYDWRRLKSEVLLPVPNGNIPEALIRNRVVIVEGCFSLRNELQKYYELRIFTHVPRDESLRRAVQRDGEELREFYENYWKKEEDSYIKTHDPMKSAELVIDGCREIVNGEVSLKLMTTFSLLLSA
jgi:uridine kinase